MVNITFIRHGETEGNLAKRYIGVTNESLCQAGVVKLEQKIRLNIFPQTDKIIVSPMLRCIETAKIIYPTKELFYCNLLKECNFGDFENKNYQELGDNSDYQKWIESNGTLPFPNGESIEDFKQRCRAGFHEILEKFTDSDLVFVVHGGTIMAILEKYAMPRKSFYNWKSENGSGFSGKWNGYEIIDVYKID